MLNFIDVARDQEDIDLSVIPNLHGVIVGCTFGAEGVNPFADKQFQQAKRLNLLRGVYHIRNNSNHTPQEEADYFVDNILGYLDGHTVLVLDWECCDTSDVEWAYAWLCHVRQRTGVTPIIYMSEAVVNAHDWSKVSAEFSLWIAQYNYSTIVDGFQQWDATYHVNWPVVAMWQYASTDLLPGYNKEVDVSIFYGDANAWAKYAAKNGAVATTPAPAPKPAPAPAPKPVVAPSHPSTGNFPVTVERGVSLWSIANQFHTTVPAILAINHIPNPNVIFPGQVLYIPGKAAPVVSGSKGQWIVDPGNTLGYIANYYGVSVESIVNANKAKYPSISDNYIQTGWVLNIP